VSRLSRWPIDYQYPIRFDDIGCRDVQKDVKIVKNKTGCAVSEKAQILCIPLIPLWPRNVSRYSRTDAHIFLLRESRRNLQLAAI